jgi:hypothetical protein
MHNEITIMSNNHDNGASLTSKGCYDGNNEDTYKKLKFARYGAHYIIIYPDLPALRKIYSQYIKRQIEEKNEIVLILPHYETTDTVRFVLSKLAGIDAEKLERDDLLLIIDSSRAYFGASIDIISFVDCLIDYAAQASRAGVSVLADMGSFFYYDKLDYLLEHETSLPTRFDMKAKGFCLYNKRDFDWRLSLKQKKELIECHGRQLLISTNTR